LLSAAAAEIAVAGSFKMRVRGIPAWFIRRTYYLLQMPAWHRRLRIMIDWTFALLFRPDIVKISLDSEMVERLRESAAGAIAQASDAPPAQHTATDKATHSLTTGATV